MSIARSIQFDVAGLTDSATVRDYCERHGAKVKLILRPDGRCLFGLIRNGELLTPIYKSGRGLIEHLHEAERQGFTPAASQINQIIRRPW